MLPYVHQPILLVGPFTLHAFGALAAVAIFVGRAVILRRARAAGLDSTLISRGCFCALLAGIMGGLSWSFAGGRPGISVFGVLSGGLIGGAAYWRRQNLSPLEILRTLDVVAFAIPFALVFGRLGCALAHDHPGRFSTNPFAVCFPEGPRYDLGLLEFFFMTAVAGVFFFLGRRRRPDGFFTGVFSLAYGCFRMCIETLRPNGAEFAGEAGALSMMIFGIVVLTYVITARLTSAPPLIEEFE
jgi:phosphatidylglycerol:prolipoprotein diacylglycerol transferase